MKCRNCRKPIKHNGKHWVHTTHNPRHIAMPEERIANKEETPVSSCSSRAVGYKPILITAIKDARDYLDFVEDDRGSADIDGDRRDAVIAILDEFLGLSGL